MRRSTFLFGLAMFAAGLAVGGLIGFQPGGSGSSAPPKVPSPPAVTAPADGTAAPLPARAAPAPAAGPSVAPSAGPRVPASPAGTVQGAITGSVTGPDGAPIEGVLVRATPFESGKEEEKHPTSHLQPGSPPPRLDVEVEVRDFARRLGRREAGVREALTDASGAYVLSGLSAKSYFLQAWRVGYQIERSGAFVWKPVAPGSRCDFHATPIRRVSVSVTLPDGKPPEQAVI